MAKKYLNINLSGDVEAHVRAESKRLNISASAYVAMTVSRAMLPQVDAGSTTSSQHPAAKMVNMPQVEATRPKLTFDQLPNL